MRYNIRDYSNAVASPPVALRPVAFCCSLCIAMLIGSQDASALTIGNVRGAVLVGKPVNVTVPVTLDPGETPASACAEVEISFADARIDSSRVRTSWLPADAKGETSLRIQSTIAVDEPMINIWLKAGCVRKSERRFVLLADVVSESAGSGPVAVEAFSPALPLVVTQTQSPAPNASLGRAFEAEASTPLTKPVLAKRPRKEPVAEVTAPKPDPVKPNVSTKASKPVKAEPTLVTSADEAVKPQSQAAATKPAPIAVQPAAKAKDDVVPKARLKLEGLPDFNLDMKTSMSLAMAPTEDLQARENARAMWRSLNASPEELASISKRLAALESEAKVLKDGKAKVQADQDAMKSQLEKAEEDRYSNWLVGLLGALFVGASAVAGLLWWRSRQKSGWSPQDLWHGSGDGIEPSNLSDLAPADSGLSGAMPIPKSGQLGKRSKKAGAPDVDLGVDESLFDSLRSSALQPLPPVSKVDSANPTVGGRAFMNSMSARTVNVEELFDIQQQAEFFVSLGQHEQAIELLRQHIYTNSSTSGIAYLDLLKIYHDLDRRSEYEQLREEFNQSFNAKVSPFDKYGQQQRRGLERYPSAIARIEALWKSPRILAILQESIFRRPEAGDAECFDLEAYRELLLLFSIAKEVSGMPSGVTTTGHKPKPNNYMDSQSADHVQDEADSEADQADPTPTPTPVPASKHRPSGSRSYRSFENSVSVKSDEDSAIPVPMASPRLALDVNLFELESVFPSMDAPSPSAGPGPELGLATPAERFEVASQRAGLSSGAGISTMNAGLNEQVAAEPPLPPLDFSLSLPAEFSTALPAPAMSPKSGPAPSPSSLAFDLNKYMTQKDLKTPSDKA